jgi:hypothetical protein
MTKRLSDADREYLETRARQDLIAQNDDEHGVDPDDNEGDLSSREAEQANLQIEEAEVIEDDYSEMTNEELREELAGRDLSTGGNKAELQARLREDDEKE